MTDEGNTITWGLSVVRPDRVRRGQAASGPKQNRERLKQVEAKVQPIDLSALDNEEIETLAAKSTSTIRYNDILEGGVDLEYVVLPSQVKENIILNKPQDITSYIVSIQTNGLRAQLLDNGQVEFLRDDKVVFTMWSPYMFDSAGELSEDIKVELKDEGNGRFTVVMTPNAQWLNDKDRVYPITIDPTVSPSRARTNIIDNYILEGSGVQNHNLDRLYIGRRSGRIARSYIRYAQMPFLGPAAQIYRCTQRVNILSGTNTANTANAYIVNSNWASSTIKWSNQPSTGFLLSSNISHNDRTHYSFDISSAVKRWYNCAGTSVQDPSGKINNYGIMMRYTNENINDYNAFYSADYSVESKRPQLTIEYYYGPTPTPTPTPKPSSIVWPIDGYNTENDVTSYWGFRNYKGNYRMHKGIDIRCSINTDVYAAISGTVENFSGTEIGIAMIVKSGDFQTRYFHLNKRVVADGLNVSAGTVIAKSGNTPPEMNYGYHLHFQVQWTNNTNKLNNPLKEYNSDDVRSDWTSKNPNPMYILRNGVYVSNDNFSRKYEGNKYNSVSETYKR